MTCSLKDEAGNDVSVFGGTSLGWSMPGQTSNAYACHDGKVKKLTCPDSSKASSAYNCLTYDTNNILFAKPGSCSFASFDSECSIVDAGGSSACGTCGSGTTSPHTVSPSAGFQIKSIYAVGIMMMLLVMIWNYTSEGFLNLLVWRTYCNDWTHIH